MKKRLPHIITLTFLIIFALQLVGLLFLLTIPENASAQAVELQVPIGGTTNINTEKTTAGIAKYIEAVYKYGIGIVGIVATVVMMIGGVSWIMAGGNAAKIGEAKTWIGAALMGLVLALTSYTILNTINPDLTSFTPKEIKMIKPIEMGCCEKDGEDIGPATEERCTTKGGRWGGKNSIWSISKKDCVDPEDAYFAQANCKGTTIASTLGGPDSNITSTDCPQHCSPYTVNFGESFWYGEYDEIYCCICSVCNGSNDGIECGSGKTCQGGICMECETLNGWCDPGDCCAGLFCDESLFPDKCVPNP